MQPLIVPGSAHRSLAEALAHELQSELASCLIEPFPDGEQEVEIRAHVRGRPVFIVQPLGAPVGEHLLELLLLADACRRAGAGSVTAIVPYVGYARQDRITKEGQPLGARVLAEALGTGSFSQVIAVDLHSPVVASCIHAPVVHLTAIPDLVEALRPDVPDDAVVVSPDLGAVKVAESYARPLGLPLAVLHKIRVSGTAVAVHSVVGDVRGKRPIVVDDMISTGATVEAAMDALLASGCQHEFIVAATHGLFAGKAVERLDRPEMLRGKSGEPDRAYPGAGVAIVTRNGPNEPAPHSGRARWLSLPSPRRTTWMPRSSAGHLGGASGWSQRGADDPFRSLTVEGSCAEERSRERSHRGPAAFGREQPLGS